MLLPCLFSSGGKIKSSKGLQHAFTILTLALSLAGCTTSVEPPGSSSNAFRTINYNLCKEASFKFKKQTPKSLRSLIECVNGQDGVIQPYLDFVNATSDEDLKVYIDSFDEHFSPYLNQALDLMNRMQDRGLLRELSKNISVIVESGMARSGLELWRKSYGNNGEISDEALAFNSFLRELIETDQLKGALRGWAGLFDNSNAWALAYLLSRQTDDPKLASAKVADILANTIDGMIVNGDLNSVLIYASDRLLHKNLKELTAADISELGHMFDVIMEDSSPNGALAGYQKIHREISKEVDCFGDNKGSRHTVRLDEINALEQIRRKGNKESLDRLLMVEAPFMLASAVRDCTVPASVLQNYKNVFDLGARGVTPGLAAVNFWYYTSGRLNYMARTMKSNSLLSFANMEQLFTARGGMPYRLKSIQSLPSNDFNLLSRVVTRMAIADLKEGDLLNWIRAKLPKSIQAQALDTLGGMKNPKLSDFIAQFSNDFPLKEGALREALSDSEFKTTENTAFYKLIRKMLSPELRPQLADFFAGIAKSWNSTRGGIGPTFSVMAESSYLAEENPFQNWFRALFMDRAFQKKWFATTNKVVQSKEFLSALDFTGKFAQSSEFDGFLKFMIDIFRYSDQKGLQTDPISGGYQSPPKHEFGSAPPLPPASKAPPGFKYGSCRDLKGSIWEKGGELLYSALKCVGGDRADNGLVKLAELLKSSGDLADFTDIMSRHLFSQENAHLYLEDLRLLQKSGDLSALMEFMIKSRRIGPDAIASFEKLMSDYLGQTSAANSLESLGPILKSRYLGDVIYAFLDTWESEQDKTFFRSSADFVMPLPNTEALTKQAKDRVPKASAQHIQHALKSFALRDSNYFYEQGLYKAATESEIQADVYRMLQLLLRTNRETKTGDIEEFVKALQDIWEWHRLGKVNVTEFVRWGSSYVKPVPFYVGEEENPQVRFVAPFDQLDILVAHSDYSVAGWVPFVGVDHLGTYFQIQVAESRNLAATIEDLRSIMEKVVGWGGPFIDRTKYNMLRNDLENFTVLEEANRRGHLVILQRLYQAFYNATPPRDRKKESVEKNHMSLVHQPTRWAMFSRLVSPLRHVDSEGQLDHLIGIIGQLLKSLGPGEEVAVRAAFDNLMYRPSGQPAGMDHVLGLIFQNSRSPDVFNRIKDQMYHTGFALGRNLGRGRVLFEALSEMSPAYIGRVIERYNRRLLIKGDDTDLKFISRWASLDPEMSKLVRAWTSEVSFLSPRGRTYLGEVLDPFFDILNSNDRDAMNFIDAVSAILKHPEVKAKNLKATMKRVFNEYQTVKKIIPQVLANTRDRQVAHQILRNLTSSNRFQSLVDAIIEIYDNGQLDDLLTIVNDYSAYKNR